jgi:spermidine synthase
MGATLPAVSRWVSTTPNGVSWLGFFYGGNTAGAVVGCLLAGFYLLRLYDMATATCVAAAINGGVALVALVASYVTGRGTSLRPASLASPIHGSRSIYLVIALSGMSALGAEVVWTRILSLLLGATVYTFSIILAVFLIGLGIGSSLGAMFARSHPRPRLMLGACQLLLAGAIAWTAYALAKSLPYWPIDPSIASKPAFTFQIDLMRCLWAIFPATLLWGASFPLALAAAARGGDPARLVGGVYAANTLGAIVGALVFSLILIPCIGTQESQRVMIAIAALAAIVTFALPIRASTVAWVSLTTAAAAGLAWTVSAVPWELVAYGRYMATTNLGSTDLYVGEGINSSVAVTQEPEGWIDFHVAGKVEASTEPQDMRLQRMLGDLPGLIHPKAQSVLIVGCGAGVTAGSFVVQPDIKKIVICEIEPLVPKVVSTYFATQNYDVVHDPRVTIVYDDARHFVLTTHEKFDIITSDPIHPWVKGAATLYTREYFEICKQHLNPGGIVTQWVPLYQSTEETVKGELATFFDAFPDGTVWSNDYNNSGYDVVLMGRDDQSKIDVDALQARLDQEDHHEEAASLQEVGFPSAISLLATYAGQARDMRSWLADAQINHDSNLRLQYLAGLGMDSKDSDKIFNDMMSAFVYPQNVFRASHAAKLELDVAMLRSRMKR